MIQTPRIGPSLSGFMLSRLCGRALIVEGLVDRVYDCWRKFWVRSQARSRLPPPGSCPVWHPAVASFVAVALALELVGAVLHAASDVGERKVDRRVVLQLGAGLRPSAHVRNPCPFVE